MGITIRGTGKYVPEKILTNADLEKMVETSDEWITTRTGIRERHLADAGIATSDLAYQAAKQAQTMAQILKERVEKKESEWDEEEEAEFKRGRNIGHSNIPKSSTASEYSWERRC